MVNTDRIKGTSEAWDSGALGQDERYVVQEDLSEDEEALIDAAMAMQPISIRLPKSLIEDFKLIAELNGLGYQPLMRQTLARFADCEKKRLLREAASKLRQEQDQGDSEDELQQRVAL